MEKRRGKLIEEELILINDLGTELDHFEAFFRNCIRYLRLSTIKYFEYELVTTKRPMEKR